MRDLLDAADRVLSFVETERAEVYAIRHRTRLIRIGAGRIVHGPVDITRIEVAVRLFDRGKIGIASTGSLDNDALSRMVEAAAFSLASADPVSPMWEPTPADESIEVESPPLEFDEGRMFAAAKGLISLGGRLDAEAAGVISTTETSIVFGNLNGLLSTFSGQTGLLKLMLRDGRLEVMERVSVLPGNVPDVEGLLDSLGRRFSQLRSAPHLGTLEGDVPVVLMPAAVSEMISIIGFLSFSGEAARKGYSKPYMLKGSQIASDLITIRDDHTHPLQASMPFDFEGRRRRVVSLVDGGIARGVVHSGFTAAALGEEPTGHALPFSSYFMPGPLPLHLVIDAGDGGDIVSQVDDAVVVSAFHYVNAFLDPVNVRGTGLSRFGTYRVKGGKIVGVYDNSRFLQGFWDALMDVRAVGSVQVPVPTEWRGVVVSPPLYIEKFHFGA